MESSQESRKSDKVYAYIMKHRILTVFVRHIIGKLKRSYPRILKKIEQEISRSQGWGWSSKEAIEVDTAINLLNQLEKSDLVLLDIGCHRGAYSQAILDRYPNTRIYAFEPSSTSFKFLSKQFEFQDNVRLFNVALGSKSSMEILWSNEPGSALSSLQKRDVSHFATSFDNFEEVQVVTLDEWNLKFGLKPDIIKIDVEGFELKVIEGGEKTILQSKVVQFEYGGTHIDTRTFFRDFWVFFRQHGFTIFQLTPYGITEISGYEEILERFQLSNFYAVNPFI
jgi:FkbM family methyltransferase